MTRRDKGFLRKMSLIDAEVGNAEDKNTGLVNVSPARFSPRFLVTVPIFEGGWGRSKQKKRERTSGGKKKEEITRGGEGTK